MKQIIILLLAFSSLNCFGNNTDGETRTATISYDITSSDKIEIQAKYTDLIVEAWEKNEVLIEATVRFDGKITDKMTRFLDSFEKEVKENITYGAGVLTIKTKLDEPNKVQIGSKHVGIVIGFNEDELKLSYKVMMPSSNKVVINSSYKDLNMYGSFAEVEIDQYSGELQAENIEVADLKLKYGKAKFNSINEAEMELYEQEITANSISELEIDTKYSELNIDQLGPTDITSYETDFEIGVLEKIEGSIKYGEMEITDILREGRLTTYEFDIDADAIGTLVFNESKYGKLEARLVERLGLEESYEDNFDLGELGSLISEDTKYGEYKVRLLTGKFKLNGYEDEINIYSFGTGASEVKIEGKYIDASIDIEGRSYNLNASTKYGSIDVDRSSKDVRKYIKDGDQIEVEASSKVAGEPIIIIIKGYEMKVDFD